MLLVGNKHTLTYIRYRRYGEKKKKKKKLSNWTNGTLTQTTSRYGNLVHKKNAKERVTNMKNDRNLFKIADVMHFAPFIYQITYISDTFFLVAVVWYVFRACQTEHCFFASSFWLCVLFFFSLMHQTHAIDTLIQMHAFPFISPCTASSAFYSAKKFVRDFENVLWGRFLCNCECVHALLGS